MTRTPEQIDRILAAVREAWLRNPEKTLGALLEDCSTFLSGSAYICEDDDLVKNLRDGA